MRVIFHDPVGNDRLGNPDGAVVIGMLREVVSGRDAVGAGRDGESEMRIGRVMSRGMEFWGAGAACVRLVRRGRRRVRVWVSILGGWGLLR